jgi:hypothetical protein
LPYTTKSQNFPCREMDLRHERTSMLKAIRKWLAIRDYAKRLGPKLRERYGPSKRYTAAQVKRTIEVCDFNSDYACYALSMYCSRSEFDAYHETRGAECDYDVMHQYHSDSWFLHPDTLHHSGHAASGADVDWHDGHAHDAGHHGDYSDGGDHGSYGGGGDGGHSH